jgi:hypothetical protein
MIKAHKNSNSENLKQRQYLGDLDTEWGILLK